MSGPHDVGTTAADKGRPHRTHREPANASVRAPPSSQGPRFGGVRPTLAMRDVSRKPRVTVTPTGTDRCRRGDQPQAGPNPPGTGWERAAGFTLPVWPPASIQACMRRLTPALSGWCTVSVLSGDRWAYARRAARFALMSRADGADEASRRSVSWRLGFLRNLGLNEHGAGMGVGRDPGEIVREELLTADGLHPHTVGRQADLPGVVVLADGDLGGGTRKVDPFVDDRHLVLLEALPDDLGQQGRGSPTSSRSA